MNEKPIKGKEGKSKYTVELINKIILMYNDGTSFTDIANQLSTASLILNKNKISSIIRVYRKKNGLDRKESGSIKRAKVDLVETNSEFPKNKSHHDRQVTKLYQRKPDSAKPPEKFDAAEYIRLSPPERTAYMDKFYKNRN